MSSARERFKKANSFVQLGSEANKETIVDDIIKDLDSTPEKKDEKKPVVVEAPVIKEKPVISPEPQKTPAKRAPESTKEQIRHVINPAGRPRIYDGGYHNYAARLRNDVFDYIKTTVGEDKPYKSINEYLNALVLRDMQDFK